MKSAAIAAGYDDFSSFFSSTTGTSAGFSSLFGAFLIPAAEVLPNRISNNFLCIALHII